MKLVSWNVNGLRACVTKGFSEFFEQADADFFCLQETKLQEGQIDLDLPGYYQYWNYAVKKGYSGTAIFTKHEPISVSYGIYYKTLQKKPMSICTPFLNRISMLILQAETPWIRQVPMAFRGILPFM